MLTLNNKLKDSVLKRKSLCELFCEISERLECDSYSRSVVAFLPLFIADCKSSSILSFMRFRRVTMLRDEKVSRSSFSCA